MDWRAGYYVDGQLVGNHTGGYAAHTLDITYVRSNSCPCPFLTLSETCSRFAGNPGLSPGSICPCTLFLMGLLVALQCPGAVHRALSSCCFLQALSSAEEHELIVGVLDMTELGPNQPLGKQRSFSHGGDRIVYTSVSGQRHPLIS